MVVVLKASLTLRRAPALWQSEWCLPEHLQAGALGLVVGSRVGEVLVLVLPEVEAWVEAAAVGVWGALTAEVEA